MKKPVIPVILLFLAASASAQMPDSATVGGYAMHRFRIEMWDDGVMPWPGASVPTGANAYTRDLTRAGLVYRPAQGWELTAGLDNEFRYNIIRQTDFTMGEVIVERLSVSWRTTGNLPTSVKIGRQDLVVGEGFLIQDGTPLDGSRTFYFNAAVGKVGIAEGHTLGALAMYQPFEDDLLPIANRQHTVLAERTGTTFGVMYDGLFGDLTLQGMALHTQFDSSSRMHVTTRFLTFDLRAVWKPLSLLAFTAESALETGRINAAGSETPMQAYGGHAFASLRPGLVALPGLRLDLGMLLLSGDDPATPEFEGWDPMYARYPKWSESVVYALAAERGSSYWTNISSLFCRLSCDLSTSVNLQVDYHHMRAPEQDRAGVALYGGGSLRGNLLLTALRWKLDNRLTGHVWWEKFWRGDYYQAPSPSPRHYQAYNWFRVEVRYSWEG
jgi:hypothetical protein